MNDTTRQSGAARTAHWQHGWAFTLFHIVPLYLQGLFTRNRFWVTVFDKLHRDPLSVRFLSRLRRKYRCQQLFIRIGRTPALLLMDVDSIRHVLDHSPEIYAEPAPKREGMSRFQPGAVTISRGLAWQSRRRLNEAVLESTNALHQYAGAFSQLIMEEVNAMLHGREHLRWKDFERLFERISLGIIFGSASRDDTYLIRTLNHLMRNGNLAAVRRPQEQRRQHFAHALRSHLHAPEENSLVHLCATTNADGHAEIQQQVPHWMFAMNETLSVNTTRALALIAAQPEVQNEARNALSTARLNDPNTLRQQTLLSGCLQEAMRLWPTTPMLMREAVRDDVLGETEVRAGTRVIIFNSFNHRDAEADPSADTFQPQRWGNGHVDYRVNHLSNGMQVCAGKHLALFIGTAVLANLLKPHRYRLERPNIDSWRALPWKLNHYRLRFHVAT